MPTSDAASTSVCVCGPEAVLLLRAELRREPRNANDDVSVR